VREFAAERGIGTAEEAVEAGLREKAEEFRKEGAEVYRPA